MYKDKIKEKETKRRYYALHRKERDAYYDQWIKDHPGKSAEYNKKYRKTHPQKRTEKSRVYAAEWSKKFNVSKRLELLRLYGGKCTRCGFDDFRALQIDHIDGGGTRECRAIGRHNMYKKMVESKSLHKNEYQILCANCNWIKRYENNETKRRVIQKLRIEDIL